MTSTRLTWHKESSYTNCVNTSAKSSTWHPWASCSRNILAPKAARQWLKQGLHINGHGKMTEDCVFFAALCPNGNMFLPSGSIAQAHAQGTKASTPHTS
jgi:hypothetical protein